MAFFVVFFLVFFSEIYALQPDLHLDFYSCESGHCECSVIVLWFSSGNENETVLQRGDEHREVLDKFVGFHLDLHQVTLPQLETRRSFLGFSTLHESELVQVTTFVDVQTFWD